VNLTPTPVCFVT